MNCLDRWLSRFQLACVCSAELREIAWALSINRPEVGQTAEVVSSCRRPRGFSVMSSVHATPYFLNQSSMRFQPSSALSLR